MLTRDCGAAATKSRVRDAAFFKVRIERRYRHSTLVIS
jgi:hypothetical protein